MPAKFLPHPFDARSVMLFASLAFGSALAQAQTPAAPSARTATSTLATNRPATPERNLQPGDPRRHQLRQPVKKAI